MKLTGWGGDRSMQEEILKGICKQVRVYKEELRKELSDRLQGYFGAATLSAAGYTVDLNRRLHDDSFLLVDVYVNSQIDPVWAKASEKDGSPIYPEAQFWCPQHTSIDRGGLGVSRNRHRVMYYEPTFPTVPAAVVHIINKFPDLEIINRNQE
jgi:hypothetical protein